MVNNATSFSGNGLRDWLVQRVSALILAAYVIFLIGFYFFSGPLDYTVWHGLFAHTAMKVASLLVLVSLLLHAWVGVWTIFTDYIKPAALRLVLNVLVILALACYLLWGLNILWGV